jgi:hypothetical protein
MLTELQSSDAKAIALWTRQLLQDGFCIIRDVHPTPSINKLNDGLNKCFADTPFCDGDFYGRRTKRFGALLNRSPIVADLVRHPLILGIASDVLGSWCDRFNLNLTQGIEIHPGAPAQFPHRDQDMWDGPKGEMQYLLNVIWPLNDFTEDNGATRIWPNSRPDDVINARWPGVPFVAEMEPGAALLFLGSMLHAAGANKTASARRGLIISYCLGWLKPFENQWLCYPPHIARQFDPDLASLVGYSLHKPNLGNYEGQCPSILLGDNPPASPAATDALRPDQEEALAGFMAAMEELEARGNDGEPGN